MVSTLLGWVGVILTVWCVYFFRNPVRFTPDRPGAVISPADGIVQSIAPAIPPAELELGDAQRPRVSIFMNVFDVHVNRVPVDGVIDRSVYRAGKFLNAALDKASDENERQSLCMTTADGKTIAFVQIAGLVARRILCEVHEGQEVVAGERFGLIRFGSRVDVYLDHGMEILVSTGQRMVAGETVLSEPGRGQPELASLPEPASPARPE